MAPEDRRLNARASRFLLLLAAAVGFASFGYYYSRGLTTAHYDAKASSAAGRFHDGRPLVALDTVAREHLRSLLGIDLSRAVFVASDTGCRRVRQPCAAIRIPSSVCLDRLQPCGYGSSVAFLVLSAGVGVSLLPSRSRLIGLPAVALLAFLIARAAGGYRWPLLLLAVLGAQMPALDGENRPILAETLEHQSLEGERQRVLLYLRENYDGTRLLIDIGKLAPLVYDSGLPVRGFVYSEGLWERARRAPHQEVGWILAGNDEIWTALQVDPHWADRYSLALKADNYRVYRLGSADRDALLK